MHQPFIERIDATGLPVPIGGREQAALLQGEALHCSFRPRLTNDYARSIALMAGEGAAVLQLVDDDAVCALAVWRTFLTSYCGRRFEIDDLVTAEGRRSKGYGATLLRALEAKARSLACEAIMLTSATWRVDAHRFYLRECFGMEAFLFVKRSETGG